MNDHVRSILILLFIFCTVTCTGPVASIENNHQEQGSGNPKIAALGKCRITIVGTSLWRDWMPIVEHPGPDGGSPLHARIKLWMDNSAGEHIQISFQAVIEGDKARIGALPLHVLPNFRVLPEDVRKSFNSLDEKARKKILAQYNVIWDGVLKKGESREVELASAGGPYIPVGDRVHVEMTLTDRSGNRLLLKSPESIIGRTD